MALLGAVKQGTKAALDAGLLSPGIRAYHGSPHDFDRFSTGSIGTGEGNQAYGHGLYFAESEDVARNYRDSLTKLRKDGTTPAPKDSIAGSYEAEYGLSEYESFPMTSLDDVRETIASDAVDISSDVNGNTRYEFSDGSGYLITSDGKVTPSGPLAGRMYEVDIAVSPDELLRWDAPLRDQPAAIQKIFPPENYPETFTGSSIYDLVAGSPTAGPNRKLRADGMRESAPYASARLQELGIKGIEYPDAFTRHKSPDKQSKNYVIFDDRLIEISRKYGVTIPIAAAMLQQSNEAEAGFLTTPANLIRLGMLTVESAQNPTAVKSALTKYDKAMRESKAFRAREKLRSDVENQTQTLDIGERNLLTVDDLVGKVGVPVSGDTSTTGKVIETIGGVNLESPVQVEGGSNFPLRYQDQNYGWASMADAARKKQGNFALAADETGMEPVGIFSAMGKEAVNFSTPVAESMLQQARALPIKKSDIKKFDDELRKLRPEWVGLNHPGAMDQLMGRGDYPQKGAGKLRSVFVEEMSKSRYRDVGFPVKEDAHAEILQPELANAPIGSSGFSMFSANPNAPTMPNAPHQSYDTIIPGTYIGGLEQSVPARVMYPDVYAELDKATNVAGQPFTESQKTGSLVMNPKLYQPFNEQWAEGVDNYLRQNKQSGAATPAAIAAAGGAGLLGAQAVQQKPTLAEQGIGILDAAVNAASGFVAPILSAPSAITRYAAHRLIPGVNFSGEEMAQARRNVEDVFDYQPRTELGQQYSNQALMALGGLLAPVVEASEGSKILGLLGDAYDYIGPQRRELVNAILDMSGI